MGDFGFDWLIGFESSLEAAGTLQDLATPGTGDETSDVGTSVVSDPAGWTGPATRPRVRPPNRDRQLMNWEEIAVAAPAAFLLGLIVGYVIRGRYHLEKTEP